MSDTPTTGVAQATPDGELRRQILSHFVPKNEREWWAARAIERLEFELNAANDRIKRLEDACDEAIAFCELLTPVAQTPNTPELVAKNLRKAKEAKP